MRTVTRFEADLLRITQALVGRLPVSQVLPILGKKQARPKCLSRGCVELICQYLARGCTQWLVQAGGWQCEPFLRNQRVVVGRVWQRWDPATLGLNFSVNALSFLLWLTSANVAGAKSTWHPAENSPLTLGDQFLLFLAYLHLRGSEFTDRWVRSPLLRDHSLCQLAFADDWGEVGAEGSVQFDTWLTDGGASVLESLQSWLAQRWLEIEQSKSRVRTPARMLSIGGCQQRVLTSLLDQLEAVGRRDLARFLLIVGSQLLTADSQADRWFASVDTRGLLLAQRQEVQRAALATVGQLPRLRRWDRQARGVAFFDEEYAASQLWKSDWERYGGDVSADRADAVVRSIQLV